MGRFQRGLSAAAITFALALPLYAAPITVTDAAGRVVTLPGPAQRVVLAEARQIPALSIVAADFDQRIAGLAALKRFDTELQRDYFARFPALAAVPQVDGDRLPSAEKIIAAGADLLILSGGSDSVANSAALAEMLESVGIPTLFVDFRADPYANTVPSIRALGAALGHPERAETYVDYIEAHRQHILDRIAEAQPERPTVFLQMQPQVDGPLTAPGAAGVGAMIEAAGGRNIGAEVVPGIFGPLSAEYVIAADPQVWIGTGGTHFGIGRGIVTGPDVTPDTARASIDAFLDAAPIISGLSAVRTGRAYGIWHNYLNTSLNIVALEMLATWLHPNLFADLSPEATQAEINRRFLPVPLNGTMSVHPGATE
ncbi:ABC transporter substrate-binding protein [Puniceibacterium sp. IMCC21224]|uniref:ABC transporter substrate-binding protein n=1 Tax=Puniceibacterium sp. IMCC21224 TaxID=1618204 RepID=UPI00064DD41D|nr:ABC transporter substrate-binding protein [Puniceibacterium sp. IMCC21224]KMK67003.1 ABC-type Fe3+-hydroxamate transport system, periplasmic component [Puniceibacterium sp. IMCC21224]